MSEEKTYNQLYYEKHKDDRKVKTTCEICNGTYNTNSKYYHVRSKKHQNAVKLNEKNEEIVKLNNTIILLQYNHH